MKYHTHTPSHTRQPNSRLLHVTVVSLNGSAGAHPSQQNEAHFQNTRLSLELLCAPLKWTASVRKKNKKGKRFPRASTDCSSVANTEMDSNLWRINQTKSSFLKARNLFCCTRLPSQLPFWTLQLSNSQTAFVNRTDLTALVWGKIEKDGWISCQHSKCLVRAFRKRACFSVPVEMLLILGLCQDSCGLSVFVSWGKVWAAGAVIETRKKNKRAQAGVVCGLKPPLCHDERIATLS